MALYKSIKQPDGVITTYHRVLFVSITTNHHNSVAVLSYVDEESRLSDGIDPINRPYQQTVTYETSYDPAMSVEAAYEYLKTLPLFEGAENI